MSVVLNNNGTLSITAMSLVEFLPEIETAIHNGYMLDLEKNEGVPQSFGSMFVLTMYPCGLEITDDPVEALEDALKVDSDFVQDSSLSTNSGQVTTVNKVVESLVLEVKTDGRKRKTSL